MGVWVVGNGWCGRCCLTRFGGAYGWRGTKEFLKGVQSNQGKWKAVACESVIGWSSSSDGGIDTNMMLPAWLDVLFAI